MATRQKTVTSIEAVRAESAVSIAALVDRLTIALVEEVPGYYLVVTFFFFFFFFNVITMSEAAEEEDINNTIKVECCASCGIAGVDDVKLKDCSACHLVKYCGIECQKEHRPKHKKECKKRAAELRDEILFKQPEGTDLFFASAD